MESHTSHSLKRKGDAPGDPYSRVSYVYVVQAQNLDPIVYNDEKELYIPMTLIIHRKNDF